MRFLYTILFCFFISITFSFAQEEEPVKPPRKKISIEHDLGLNATFLINQFLNFNGSELAENPYVLIYKLRLGKIGIRAALGGKLENEKKDEENFVDTREANAWEVNSRLGVEFRKAFGNRWYGHFGLDGVSEFSTTELIDNSGFDEFTTRVRTNSFGGGPVIGLSFFLNEKLSLYTEGTFYYLFSETQAADLLANSPAADDRIQNTNRQFTSLTLPASVFLVFTF